MWLVALLANSMHPTIVLAPSLHPPRPHPASSMPCVLSQRWIEVCLASLYRWRNGNITVTARNGENVMMLQEASSQERWRKRPCVGVGLTASLTAASFCIHHSMAAFRQQAYILLEWCGYPVKVLVRYSCRQFVNQLLITAFSVTFSALMICYHCNTAAGYGQKRS